MQGYIRMKKFLSILLVTTIQISLFNSSIFAQELVKKVLPSITLKVDDLKIDVEFLNKGNLMPYDAYLVTPEIMLFLETDIDHTSEEYEDILKYYEQTCAVEIENCKKDCSIRTKSYMKTIDVLNKNLTDVDKDLKSSESSIKWYAIGSAAAGILTTILVVKVIN